MEGAVNIAFIRPSVCPSVVYIANNLRTQRPSMPKFGMKVSHFRCDSHTSFKVKQSKVRVTDGRGIPCQPNPVATLLVILLTFCGWLSTHPSLLCLRRPTFSLPTSTVIWCILHSILLAMFISCKMWHNLWNWAVHWLLTADVWLVQCYCQIVSHVSAVIDNCICEWN